MICAVLVDDQLVNVDHVVVEGFHPDSSHLQYQPVVDHDFVHLVDRSEVIRANLKIIFP